MMPVKPRFRDVLIALALILLALTPIAALADPYTPAYDRDEQENINVYEQASKATVTINALVDGNPSSGTGIIIDNSGIVLTASHVVGNATVAYVSLEDGRKAKAAVIGRTGTQSDLALLKIGMEGSFPAVRLADSSKIRVGQKVLTIGNPYGFERTLSTGIVSRLDKQRDRIQTDAAINPGCSGGPLLDSQGYLIGINVTIFNPNTFKSYGGDFHDKTNIGIGFAVPINTVKTFLRDLAASPAMPPTVAALSKKPVIRYTPTLTSGTGTGYENVSIILQKFSN